MSDKQSTKLFFGDGFYVGTEHNLQSTLENAQKVGNATAMAVYNIKQKQNIGDVKIGVMYNEKQPTLEQVCHYILKGVSGCGAQAFDLKAGFLPLCAYSCFNTLCDVCVYIYSDKNGEICALLLGPGALPVSHSFEKEYEKALLSGFMHSSSFAQKPNEEPFCHITSLDGIQCFYEAFLVRICKEICGNDALIGQKFIIEAQSLTEICGAKAFLEALHSADAEIIDDQTENAKQNNDTAVKIQLGPDENDFLLSQKNTTVDFIHSNAIILNYFSRSRTGFTLPFLGPEVYRKIATSAGGTINNYCNYPEKAEYFIHSEAQKDMFLNDRFMSAMLLFGIMKESSLSLDKLLKTIPEFFVYSLEIEKGNSLKRERVMTGFAAQHEDDTQDFKAEGIRLAFPKGRVTVVPHRAGGYRLISEAYSAEAAKEICSQAQRMLSDKA